MISSWFFGGIENMEQVCFAGQHVPNIHLVLVVLQSDYVYKN